MHSTQNITIKVSWTLMVLAALAVFTFKGLFKPIVYQINMSGGQDAYAPAIFPMIGIPCIYGFLLYITKTYEKSAERAAFGILVGSATVVCCQLLLAYLALVN